MFQGDDLLRAMATMLDAANMVVEIVPGVQVVLPKKMLHREKPRTSL
jgi:hypothetical protein